MRALRHLWIAAGVLGFYVGAAAFLLRPPVLFYFDNEASGDNLLIDVTLDGTLTVAADTTTWSGGTISGTIDVHGGALTVEGTVVGAGTIDSDGGTVSIGATDTPTALTGLRILGPVGVVGTVTLSGTNAGAYDTSVSGTVSSDNGWVIRPAHSTVIAPGSRLVIGGSR
jgi:hypothetical protein